jgi:hypothetical protein
VAVATVVVPAVAAVVPAVVAAVPAVAAAVPAVAAAVESEVVICNNAFKHRGFHQLESPV